MTNQQIAVQKLNEYLNDRGNHKLQKLDHGDNGYAIVRKSKSSNFGLGFQDVMDLGFKLSHMQTFNNKDEIVIFYVGDNNL